MVSKASDDEVRKALAELLIAKVAIPNHHEPDTCMSCLAVVPATGPRLTEPESGAQQGLGDLGGEPFS